MADTPLVYMASMWGVESVAGTAIIPASKRLLCTMVQPNPQITQTMYRPSSMVVPSTQILGKEDVAAALSGVLCFNDAVYYLSSLLQTATITTPAGATNTRLWTFTPLTFAPDTYKTFTVEHGFLTNGQRFAYGVVNALTMSGTEAESVISGTMFGQALTDLVTVNASPTDIAVSPVIPKQVDVYLGTALATNEVQSVVATGASSGTFTLSYEGQTTAPIAFNASAAAVATALTALTTIGTNNVTTGGGPLPTTPVTITFASMLAGIQASLITADNTLLVGGSAVVTETTPGGMTKLLRDDRWQVAIPARYVPRRTVDANQPSFSYVVQQGIDATAEIVLGYDSQSAGFMTQFRAGTTLYLTIICRGPVIEAGFSRFIKIQCPVRFTDSNRADQNAVYGITYPMALLYDTTFGGWLTVQVQNSLTSL